MQVLCIQSGPGLSRQLVQRMLASGFKPWIVHISDAMQALPSANDAAAILLEKGADGVPAEHLIAPLRAQGVTRPLIVLAGRDEWREKVASLDAGADDYLVKPVHSEEVVARLRAVIRRSAGSAEDRIVLGDLVLDLKVRCAWQAGRCLDLTRNEFRLLQLFLLAPDAVMTRRQITETMGFGKGIRPENAVEVAIARLRRKLGADRIKTVRGTGYRVVPGNLAEVATGPCVRNGEIEPDCGCDS